jgi:hypothetical protein
MKYTRGILGILEGAFAALVLWYTDRKRQQMKNSSIAKAISRGEGVHVHLREPQAVIDEREAREAMRKARQQAREATKPAGPPPNSRSRRFRGCSKIHLRSGTRTKRRSWLPRWLTISCSRWPLYW